VPKDRCNVGQPVVGVLRIPLSVNRQLPSVFMFHGALPTLKINGPSSHKMRLKCSRGMSEPDMFMVAHAACHTLLDDLSYLTLAELSFIMHSPSDIIGHLSGTLLLLESVLSSTIN